jgi:hypothetical protein
VQHCSKRPPIKNELSSRLKREGPIVIAAASRRIVSLSTPVDMGPGGNATTEFRGSKPSFRQREFRTKTRLYGGYSDLLERGANIQIADFVDSKTEFGSAQDVESSFDRKIRTDIGVRRSNALRLTR